MAMVLSLFTFLIAQIVAPNLDNLLKDLEASGGRYTYSILADYWLKLTITNTYLWLLVFYFYFHLYLNLFAELLRFGDRVFYKDWWNSTEVSAYWRLWNIPVHYWLVRHLYFPCVRHNLSKTTATFLVFFFSAVIHEVLISIPFRKCCIGPFCQGPGGCYPLSHPISIHDPNKTLSFLNRHFASMELLGDDGPAPVGDGDQIPVPEVPRELSGKCPLLVVLLRGRTAHGDSPVHD
jgi:MBOAT, membrane-bound O-acyltransferase family